MADGTNSTGDDIADIAIAAGANPAAVSASGGLSLIPAAIGGAYKLITGLKQQSEAKKKEATPRPNYTVPSAITQNVGINQSQAGNFRIAGQDYYNSQLQGNRAATIRSLIESGATPAAIATGVSAAQGNVDNGLERMWNSALDQHAKAAEGLSRSLTEAAPYQDQEFTWNKADPYMDEIKRADNLRVAGGQNVDAGLNGLGAVALKGLAPGTNTTKPGTKTPLLDAATTVGGKNTNTSNPAINTTNGGVSDWLKRITTPNPVLENSDSNLDNNTDLSFLLGK